MCTSYQRRPAAWGMCKLYRRAWACDSWGPMSTPGASGLRVRVLPSPTEVAAAALKEVLDRAERALSEKREFRIALAGGTTPRLLYERLSAAAGVAWQSWQIYFGDERCVGPEHASSNYR